MEQSLKELTATYTEKYFKDSDFVTLHDIDSVNHKPHRFCIGPKHVAHASDHGGLLTKAIVRAIPCAAPGCRLSYDEHTYDTVMFLKLKREVKTEEIQSFLKPITDDMEKDKIDGFVFIDTPEKFRVV